LMLNKVAAGFSYGGNTFQIDQAARDNMMATFTLLTAGVSNPHGGAWRDIANQFIAMDDTAVKAFILAAKAYYFQLMQASWTIKDAIGQLTTLSAIQAHDISSGWPANG